MFDGDGSYVFGFCSCDGLLEFLIVKIIGWEYIFNGCFGIFSYDDVFRFVKFDLVVKNFVVRRVFDVVK